nr:Uncharacterised protein [Salmonella sp. NCTC 7297]
MMLRRVSQRFQSRVHRTVIASSADAFQRGDLLVAHLHVINFQYCRFVFFFQLVLLTPTITRSPWSMSDCSRAEASSIIRFGNPASIAFAMPPAASICWIIALACLTI